MSKEFNIETLMSWQEVNELVNKNYLYRGINPDDISAEDYAAEMVDVYQRNIRIFVYTNSEKQQRDIKTKEPATDDVEEFVGVVRRYGVSKDVRSMIEAANQRPEVGGIDIARACGTCLLKLA